MPLLGNNVPMVSLAVSGAALYARAVSSHVRPGFRRLAMLLPVCAFFAAIPLAFSSSAILRCSAALLLTWLATFKVLLLAVDRGPLNPALPALHFLLAAALPVELEIITTGGRRRPDDKPEPSSAAAVSSSLISCTFKAAAVAAMAHLDRRFVFDDDRRRRLYLYVRLGLYGVQTWFAMEVLFACAAAACRVALAAGAGAGVRVKVKPQFVRPYMATSLRDFWGRRWNLPVSGVLRAAVYDPVRARAGKEAGILATFLVSGVMHEALLCYATMRLRLRHPAGGGGEMAAYFALHGACRVAEEWCARRWPPPPRPLATALVGAFMTATSLWLVLLPVYRKAREEMMLPSS